MLGGKWHPVVDWAEIDPELDPDEMANVTCFFVCVDLFVLERHIIGFFAF